MTNKRIEEIPFSKPTYRMLKRTGINQEEELLNMVFSDLQKIRNIGSKRVEEILFILSSNSDLGNISSIAKNENNNLLTVEEVIEKINNGDLT